MNKKINAIVFGGPSLQNLDLLKKEFKTILFLPPIKHADLLSAVEYYKPKIVGILDDFTGHGESVWHNEIIYVLEKGIKVFGASSIGALRAIELESYGMTGIGQIYNYYKNKSVINDSEVISLFDEKDNFKKMTLPMINFILSGVKSELLNTLREIYWKERTWEKIKKIISNEDFQNLKSIYKDFQYEDSLKLIREINQLQNSSIEIFDKKISENSLVRVMYERDRKVSNGSEEIMLSSISEYAVFFHPKADELFFNGFNTEIVNFFAKYLNIQISEKDIEEEKNYFKQNRGLTNPEKFKTWLKQNDISESDFNEMIEKLAYCRRMHKWFLSKMKFRRSTNVVINELIKNDEYPEYKERAIKFEETLKGKENEIRNIMNNMKLNDLIKDILKNKIVKVSKNVIKKGEYYGIPNLKLKLFLTKIKIYSSEIINKILKSI